MRISESSSSELEDIADRAHGIIVGAGSSGLIAAALLSREHDLVRIFEGGSEIGGVTRDFFNADGRMFFAGCQYLLPHYLPAEYDYSSLHIFEHRYGSLTEIDGNWGFKDDFAGPAFPDSWVELEQSVERITPEWKKQTLRGRISLYPSPIQKKLFSFVNRLVPDSYLDQISAESSAILGIGRVSSHGKDEELVRKKLESVAYDELYGVNRYHLGLNYELAATPKFGFSHFWSDFLVQMQSHARVELYKRTKINSAPILEELEAQKPGIKLWTADPRFPVRHFTKSRLESLHYKKYLTGLSLDHFDGPKLPYYINVFSSSGKLTRAYFYELEEQVRVSLESVQPFNDLQELSAELLPALLDSIISLKIPEQVVESHETKQYFPMTKRDSDLIGEATQEMSNFGWLDSGMHLYGRQSKLERIETSLGIRAISEGQTP